MKKPTNKQVEHAFAKGREAWQLRRNLDIVYLCRELQIAYVYGFNFEEQIETGSSNQ